MVSDISEQPLEVTDAKGSDRLGGAIAAVAGSGVYASFVEAKAARRPIGMTVQPDPLAAPRYCAKGAAYRQFHERLDNLPVLL